MPTNSLKAFGLAGWLARQTFVLIGCQTRLPHKFGQLLLVSQLMSFERMKLQSALAEIDKLFSLFLASDL